MERLMLPSAIAILLAFSLIGSAHANCEHYEFAELKAMESRDLKLQYCLNNIERAKQRSLQGIAIKLTELELQRPGGASMREIDSNKRKDDLATEKARQCFHENTRIFDLLRQRKFNVGAMMKECPDR